MAETSLYTDLLIPDDIKVDAINSLNFDVTSAEEAPGLGGSYKDVCIRAIRDVTGVIESYLDRKLIVRKWNIDIDFFKWARNNPLNKQQYYPRHYPVVQVETNGVTASSDKVRMLSGDKKGEVEFYAGYKRKEQTLEDLQGKLPDLSETPDDLPGDILRVAFRLVMYELTMAKQNTFATASVTKSTGQMTTEITKSRPQVYEEELSKLETYRWIL